MTVLTRHAAEEEFLQFLDYYQALWSDSPDEYHELGYRIDTWQMWAKCDGGTHSDSSFSCRNPGLHVEVQGGGETPFGVCLGPYTLKKFRAVDDAFNAMIQEVSRHVQIAIGHMHAFDQPHHEYCTVCLPDQMV